METQPKLVVLIPWIFWWISVKPELWRNKTYECNTINDEEDNFLENILEKLLQNSDGT
jgi:hypothetical protein